MSEGINRVTLFGALGADPELRYTQGGQAVLNIRMATTDSYFDKKENKRVERTDWHRVVVWGPRGVALAKILRKGSTILVEGSLRTSSYEKNGEKRYLTEVAATNIVLPPRGNGGPRVHDDDVAEPRAPQDRGGRQAAPPAEPPADGYDQGGYGGDDDGDIPF